MKKLMFVFLLTAAVMLAQATGGSTDTAQKRETTRPRTSKPKTHAKAAGKKAIHDNDKKIKKGAPTTTTTTPK